MVAQTAALEGIRVLDLSVGIAGPVAGMLMADFGADVVKVEPPEGDPARKLPGFAVWNRNKRGIVVDPFDTARLTPFVLGADVCILGDHPNPELTPERLAQRNPGMVVLYMPPYAPGHTPWATGHESHPLLSAYAGPARRQSSFDGGPIDLVYPFPLYVQAHWAAGSAVAALIEKHRSGFGQMVTVAGIHGVMVSSVGQLNIVPSQPPLPTNVGPGGRHPLYTTYQAQDGQWLFLAALIPKFQLNAFEVLGVGNLYEDERINGVPSRIIMPENRGWIRQRLADAFRTRPRDEWIALLEEGDCPAGPVGQRDVWLDHPQLIANGLRVELEDPERGHVTMPGVPIVMTQTPGCVRTPAPRLGQHDVEPWPARPAPHGTPTPTNRGPLAGYKVLDLGTILAGPYAGALLAELGADVVKVETPAGDAFRETGFVYNRGQRGLAIDLSSPAAREAFCTLVQTCDVVLDNARLGVLHRLKIDYANLAKVKPDIVTFSVTGFGEQGPLAVKPGFDPVLQAMSGMMAAQGGDSDPVLFTIPINDIAAATMSVLGICLAIFHRERCGAGQHVWTSLLGCSAMMQSGELVRVPGRQPAIWGGADFRGPSALDRFYQTIDGWVRMQAPDVASLQLAGILAGDSSRSDADLALALAETFASKTAADVVSRLTEAGIPAAVARMPGDLTEDPVAQGLEILATLHMLDGTPYFSANRYARFSRTQVCATFTPPGLGEHSREVLCEAGVASERIEPLLASGALKQGEPFTVAGIQNYR